MLRIPLVLAVVAALTVPGAVAAWNHHPYGEEPSTAYDTPPYMWQDPNTDPSVEKLYLNAFLLPVGSTAKHGALLGAWTDCNQDGYIGSFLLGASSYNSELLLSTSICPPGSLHNNGISVNEFLPVAPGAGWGSDALARVWVDEAKPAAVHPGAAKQRADHELVFVGPHYESAAGIVAPVGEFWVTAYGYSSRLDIQPPNGGHTYGVPECGIGFNWDCAGWIGTGARPGDAYTVRDTDCYDTVPPIC